MIHTYQNTDSQQNDQNNKIIPEEDQIRTEILEEEQENWERVRTAGYENFTW